MSTGTLFGLLMYSLLSKVHSVRLGMGNRIRLRNRRKEASPIMAMTINTIATVMPVDPLVDVFLTV